MYLGVTKVFKEIKKRLCDEKSDKLKTNVIVAVGLIGILLIFISGLDFGEDESKEPQAPTAGEYVSDIDSFRMQQEQRLCTILSGVAGAGNVDVMISVEGSAEYIYLQKSENKSDSGETNSGYDYKTEPVIINNSSPVIAKVVNPRITGVLIVADGAGNPVLDEKLINAAAAALGITTANICVAQKAR